MEGRRELSFVRNETARRLLQSGVFVSILALFASLAGCGDQIRTPTPEQRMAFDWAGCVEPMVDMNSILQARLRAGPYRVVPDDVLELTMPALLQAVTAAQARTAQVTQTTSDRPYICRVSQRGMITLPAVGEVHVADDSLAEIEENVINAYRQHFVLQPSVLVRVLEYKTNRVSLMGAVVKPGVYALRWDQMSLVALLMEAGGIINGGTALVHIGRLKPTFMEPPVNTFGTRPCPAGEQQGLRTTVSAQGVALTQASRSAETAETRAVFQREGPLNGTGYLAFEESGRLLVRKWLDLGNGLQRHAFVGAVAVQSHQIAVDTLEDRLAVLARYLDSHAGEPSAESGAPPSGWEISSENHFVARIQGTTATADRGSLDGPVTRAAGAGDRTEATTLVLPVRGMNVPFRDVALEDGDTVLVERRETPMFCVLGLVNRPGNFPYPPMAEYNVTQAIAFAGGLDPVADPRYVTIYRLTQGAAIARVPLQLIEHGEFTTALSTPIRPGDVVAVEHTPRTRANTIVNNLVRVNLGMYLTPQDLWDERNK